MQLFDAAFRPLAAIQDDACVNFKQNRSSAKKINRLCKQWQPKHTEKITLTYYKKHISAIREHAEANDKRCISSKIKPTLELEKFTGAASPYMSTMAETIRLLVGLQATHLDHDDSP